MALFIDGDWVTQLDMAALDSEIPDIADAESLTVEGDAGIVRQNWDECADHLLESLQAFGGDIIAWPGSLTTFGAFGISRPRLRLNQIVVSAPYGRRYSTLRRWMIYNALVLFYRAASNRRSSDRYEQKWEQFQKERANAWRQLFATGVPMVALPIAAPGALHELNAGTFGTSNVAAVASGSAAQATYDVVITWVDGTKYQSAINTQNAESGPSATVTFNVPANNVLQVNTVGLVPPASTQNFFLQRGIADGPYVTRTATGWNVYAGPTGGTLTLQNASPIPVATTSYNLPGAPTTTGAVLTQGQMADANYAMQNMLQRA